MMLKKSGYLWVLLVIVTQAQDISQFDKQFFDKLGIQNAPVVIKKEEHKLSPEKKEEIIESISWQCMRLLFNEEEFVTDKKYKAAIEAMGIEYLDRSKYASGSQKMPIISQQSLTPTERYYYERYHYYIEQKYEAPWYMKFISDTVGHGIFAAADIHKGDYVGDYTGILYDNISRAKTAFDPHYTWNIVPPSAIKDIQRFFVDAKDACNFTRFINHSFDPNVSALIIYMHDGWHLIYVAGKDIKKDEQILANYGIGYWKNETPETLNTSTH